MNSYLHRAFSATDSPAIRARLLGERIYVKLQLCGARQVRIWNGLVRTYPYPAPRDYGTRGLMVGVYTMNSRLEWIVEDIAEALSRGKS